MMRRTVSLIACLAPALAWAQFPTKPIQVISTASPGSSGDVALRMVATKMSAAMGHPVIVDVRPAARGAQMAQALAKAAPDG
ncbi:MAG TPA: tripartite tricarboxylate transporter substrate binding protein, partial [Burkholderiales bacterium]|nr:tripartite tricarboxylate transporter substrate binding protein [Burkholderiales bacterium]